jgi:hypothetical protein
MDEYQSGKFEEALRKLFLKFDESLLTPESQKELACLREMVSNNSLVAENIDDGKKIAGEADDEEEDDDDEVVEYVEGGKPVLYQSETDALYDEACMPIEEVLKRYTSTESKMRQKLRKKGVIKPNPSPMIQAPGGSTTTSVKDGDLRRNLLADEEMGPAAVSAPEKPVDFAKQEELDINEIKRNSNLPETNVSVQPHDPQEYDEASNLVRIYSLI